MGPKSIQKDVNQLNERVIRREVFDPHDLDCYVINTKLDDRPYIQVQIFNHTFNGLLDSGATVSLMKKPEFVNQEDLLPTSVRLKAANGTQMSVMGYLMVPIKYGELEKMVPVIVVEDSEQELILGITFWKAFGLKVISGNEEIQLVSKEEKQEMLNKVEPEVSLTDEQLKLLKEAVHIFLFSTENNIGKTNVLEHTIELMEGAKEYVVRPYFYAPVVEEKILDEIDRLLKSGIIEPSKSNFANPLVPVIKPTGKIRLCLDSRRLNEMTVKDQFPPPNMNHIFSRIRTTTYMSVIDLKEAFWQVPLSNERKQGQLATSREYTAFIVPGRGLMQFTVMPFGLCNSPATQSRLMYKVLGHDLEPWVMVYLDDVLIMADTVEQMIELVKVVANRLTTANLSINIEKSKFFVKKVKYLGFILTSDGIQADPEKISAMQNYPRPKTLKELRRFLGICNYYRRLIKDFSTIASPMTDCLKNSKTAFHWTEKAEKSFEALKVALCSTPVLVNPDFTKQFIVECDASDEGMGATLCQGELEERRVIAYFSAKWTPAERKYGATEKEALAVIRSIEHFRTYVYGTTFVVITDASALTHFRTMRVDSWGRLSRWALTLSRYDMEIRHRPGKQSVVPDGLSRAIATIVEEVVECDEWYITLRNKIISEPNEFPGYKVVEDEIYKDVPIDPEIGGIERLWVKVLPENNRKRLVKACHDELCHLGAKKCIMNIKKMFWWPTLARDVNEWLQECEICKGAKTPNKNTLVPMGLPRTPSYPFQMLCIDHFGPVTKSKKGNQYLFVAVDAFSKYITLRPCKTGKAELVIRILKEDIFLKFGVPECLLSDNAKAFTGKQLWTLLNQYNVTHWTIPAYHAQSNLAERFMRPISAALRSSIFKKGSDQKCWDEDVMEIEAAFNSTVSEGTGKSPNFIVFGRDIIKTGQDYEHRMVNKDRHDMTTDEINNKMKILREEVSTNLRKAYEKNRHYYDLKAKPTKFTTGERAWRRNFNLSSEEKNYSAKLGMRFVPGTIIKCLGSDTYVFKDRDGRERKLHANDLRKD